MSSTAGRLDKLETMLLEKSFQRNRGLGNEIGYYVFAYPPQDELLVRSHVSYLKNKVGKAIPGYTIVEVDLYILMMDILRERGFLEKCFQFEAAKENLEAVCKPIRATLRLTDNPNLLVQHILQQVTENCVLFLTGVGKCFPVIRSHNVLNTLGQVLDSIPVIMFFPGEYSGHSLHIFGTIEDDNYYRAFNIN